MNDWILILSVGLFLWSLDIVEPLLIAGSHKTSSKDVYQLNLWE